MADNLAALLKREQKLHGMLDLVEQFIANYKVEEQYNQLRVRLETLEMVAKDFYELREKIEELEEAEQEKKKTSTTPADAVETATGGSGEDGVKTEDLTVIDRSFQVMQEFDDRYCALKGDLLFLRDGNPQQPPSVPASNHVVNSGPVFSKVKLPEIKLPSFSGNIYEWVAFRDTFRNMIHDNPQLTAMDKYTYLRSSLTGAALLEVNSVDFAAQYYDVAWEALEKRYEIKKLIVKAYLDAIFSIEPLKKESFDGLSHLVSQFEKNLLMLQKLGEDTAGWSTILGYMVVSKLDPSTLRLWETHYCCNDVPSYEELIVYLRNHCSVLQSVAQPKSTVMDQRQNKPSVCHTLVKSSDKCVICEKSPWHSAFRCDKFQRMLLTERNDAVQRARLCRNCLMPGHLAYACSRGICHHCRHYAACWNTAVRNSAPPQQTRPPQGNTQQRQPQYRPQKTNHQPRTQNTSQNNNTNTARDSHSTSQPSTSTQNPANTTQTPSTSHTYTAFPTTPTPNVILSTAIVMLKDKHGKSMPARALLDSCSQQCLMTVSFANKLNFDKASASLAVQGIGSSIAHATKLVRADVEPRSQAISDFSEEMFFYVLPKLTVALPTATVNPSQWKLPERSDLADPNFFESGPIDVIIGAEYYLNLLENGRLQATDEGPMSVEAFAISYVCTNEELQEQLTRVWELETCWTKSKMSTEETACEEHFEATTVRDESGRFVVTLPKKMSAIPG